MGDRITACVHACLSERSDCIRIEALLTSPARLHSAASQVAALGRMWHIVSPPTFPSLFICILVSLSLSAMGHPLPPFISLLCGPPCSFACPYPVPPTVMSRTRHNTILSNTSRHFSSLISSMSVEILHPIHSPSPLTRSEERILIHEDWHYGLYSISKGHSS